MSIQIWRMQESDRGLSLSHRLCVASCNLSIRPTLNHMFLAKSTNIQLFAINKYNKSNILLYIIYIILQISGMYKLQV